MASAASATIIAQSQIITTTPSLAPHASFKFSCSSSKLLNSRPHLNPSIPLFTNPNPTSTIPQIYALPTYGHEGARNAEAESTLRGSVGENDLLIVGPGVLGRLVAEKWREEHHDCQIFAHTLTTDHHDELIKIGIYPSTRGEKATHQYPNVIFCAPRKQTMDYPGDVRLAVSNWSGEGSFLFTSSSAPYDCHDNGPCDEDTPSVPLGKNPRTDVLIKAEMIALEFGGCVLRLAGLYKADRGAHVYWLNRGTVEAGPDRILNLIHYEDAASLSIAVLKKKLHGRVFLGCDNHPLSRQEIMDLVYRSGRFNKKFEGFTGMSDPFGKKLDNSKTRQEIGWEPKYASLSQFLGISE